MNMHFKPLDRKDKDQMIELINSRPQVFNGYTDSQFKESMLDKIDEFFQDDLYYLPGIWVDNKLIGKEAAGSPSWVWGYWVSRPDASTIFYNLEGMKVFRQADYEIFREMEDNRKLNRFFVAYRTGGETDNLKNVGMSERLFTKLRKTNFRVSRYKFITDCEVMAGTEAVYPYQRAILADRAWPFDVAIRMGVLIET